MPRPPARKQPTDERSFTTQASEPKATTHSCGAGEAEQAKRDFQALETEELTQYIRELESFVADTPGRKAAIEANCGSMDKALPYALADPEIRKILEENVRGSKELRNRGQEVLHTSLARFIAQIADVPKWEALAASDPKEYRRNLDSTLGRYKRLLNAICGIKSHRPANDSQNSLIWEIKSSRPDWSFGQVAHEYTRRTNKPMTAKTAERTYARTNPEPDFLLDLGSGEMLPVLKRLQGTTKA